MRVCMCASVCICVCACTARHPQSDVRTAQDLRDDENESRIMECDVVQRKPERERG